MSTALIPGWYIEFQTALLRQAPRPNEIDQVTAEGWTKNQAGLRRVLSANLLPPETPSPANPFLRRISGDLLIPVIPATDGLGMIGKATDVFTGWIDGDFQNYGCNVTSHSTTETKVEVHELVQSATLAQIFGSFGTELDQLCLTQDQIKSFCRLHRGQLHPQGHDTFFLFKVGGGFFVADVGWRDAGELWVGVYRLSDVHVWDVADCSRVVVPQLAVPLES